MKYNVYIIIEGREYFINDEGELKLVQYREWPSGSGGSGSGN